MKQFDWEKFKNGNIAVHCKTEEEAEDFCNQMHKHGMKWRSGESYSEQMNFDLYFDRMCYYSDGQFSDLKYAERNRYTILEWSDYMQKEFTKANLKDGMTLHFEDGAKAVLVSGYYTTRDDIESVNGRLICKHLGQKVTKIEYGDNVVWEPKTKRMTAEEMRQELEELTGDKIETEPSREEMIGKIKLYCSERESCAECVLAGLHKRCDYWEFDSENLKQCYEKVMEDERKEM